MRGNPGDIWLIPDIEIGFIAILHLSGVYAPLIQLPYNQRNKLGPEGCLCPDEQTLGWWYK
jgi:hypothetical protein